MQFLPNRCLHVGRDMQTVSNIVQENSLALLPILELEKLQKWGQSRGGELAKEVELEQEAASLDLALGQNLSWVCYWPQASDPFSA